MGNIAAMSDQKATPDPTHLCPAAHSGWLTFSGRRWIQDPKRILRGLIEPGDLAIDLGCGPGFFTLPMAEMVGESGRVFAVDVQEGMLTRARVRAEQAGLATRIEFVLSEPEGPPPLGPADFALALWVLHEVPNKPEFLSRLRGCLKEGARFLLVEPKYHVTRGRFLATADLVRASGFAEVAEPRVAMSRAVLFEAR
jgi:ubiquinone/menaquinone biosynthesis C-methylase UbiE